MLKFLAAIILGILLFAGCGGHRVPGAPTSGELTLRAYEAGYQFRVDSMWKEWDGYLAYCRVKNADPSCTQEIADATVAKCNAAQRAFNDWKVTRDTGIKRKTLEAALADAEAALKVLPKAPVT